MIEDRELIKRIALREEVVRAHTGADPPPTKVAEPWFDDPFRDYDTVPAMSYANALSSNLTPPPHFSYVCPMKTLLQAGPGGCASEPPEERFLINLMVADTASLMDTAARMQTRLAVVDLSLGRDGNLEWLQQLRACCPASRIIVLSVHDEPGVRRAALATGADELVLKRCLSTDLLPTVETLLSGPSGDATGDGRERQNDAEKEQ